MAADTLPRGDSAHSPNAILWIVRDLVQTRKPPAEITETLQGLNVSYQDLVGAVTATQSEPEGVPGLEVGPQRWTLAKVAFVLGFFSAAGYLLWIAPYPLNLIIAAQQLAAVICLVLGLRGHLRK